jgi:hypothetical protein
MLRALGVRSEDRLQRLVAYFFLDTPAGLAVAEAQGEGANSEENYGLEGPAQAQLKEQELALQHPPEDVSELLQLIRAEDVIAAVKAYIEDINVEGPSGGKAGASQGKAEEDARVGQKRLNSMRNYWNQLSQVVSDDAVGVWRQLEKDCGVLREILNKRAQTIAEVDALTERNVELKRLLNEYLGDATVNAALRVPPAQVMKVRNVKGQQQTQQQQVGATGKVVHGKKKGPEALFSQTR